MTYLNTDDLAAELEQLESLDELDPTETVRLAELRELRDAVGDEWRYGVTLIPEADFEDYAHELAEDYGMVDYGTSRRWPFTCIDWKQAAHELSMDYSNVTYQGTDYLFR